MANLQDDDVEESEEVESEEVEETEESESESESEEAEAESSESSEESEEKSGTQDFIEQGLEESEDLEHPKPVADAKEYARSYRDNKFDTQGNKIIYTEDPIEITRNFVRCYRYLFNLMNTIPESDDKHKKICELVKSDKLREFNIQFLTLLNRYNSGMSFGRHLLVKKMINTIEKNYSDIHEVIDFVVPLGKVIKFYDPEENVGTY